MRSSYGGRINLHLDGRAPRARDQHFAQAMDAVKIPKFLTGVLNPVPVSADKLKLLVVHRMQ